jgi:hypothetical protein
VAEVEAAAEVVAAERARLVEWPVAALVVVRQRVERLPVVVAA